VLLVQSSEHEIQNAARISSGLDESSTGLVMCWRGGAAAQLRVLLIHDSELTVIDAKRNQQARNSYV